MAGIENVCLLRWLNRVLAGKWTSKQFHDRCIHQKKTGRVEHEICGYVNEVRPELNLISFSDVVKKYPALGVPAMFDKLVSWCKSVAKEKLTLTIRKQVMSIILAAENAEEKENQVLFSLCVCVYV